MRLNLAQALMCRSDLLLLDEPTNHLDLDAVLWLEDWLARYPGTLLLITHDRDFLDGVVDDDRRTSIGRSSRRTPATIRSSSASARCSLRCSRRRYVKQQRQIAHLQAFIDRFRAKATKAKQAQSRIKALERMERIAAAHVDSPFEFAFAPSGIAAQQLVRLEHVTLGYRRAPADPREPRLGASCNGDRIGLLGPNGAGKSTLLKAIAGDARAARPASGTRRKRSRSAISRSTRSSSCAPTNRRCGIWRAIDPAAREQELRDFLGGFDFRGDMVMHPVGRFSGGEKARLTLALLVRQKPNLLLLDEPTNHLDIEMREALAEALQDYDGALIVVAHDRHLLRATTDALWLVADGAVKPFDGDLDDYRDWVLARGRRADDEPAKRPSASQPQGAKARRSGGTPARLREEEALRRASWRSSSAKSRRSMRSARRARTNGSRRPTRTPKSARRSSRTARAAGRSRVAARVARGRMDGESPKCLEKAGARELRRPRRESALHCQAPQAAPGCKPPRLHASRAPSGRPRMRRWPR